MKKIIIFSLVIFLLVPVFVSAQQSCVPCSEPGGLVPCGRKCDDLSTPRDECLPCTLCDFFVVIDQMIDMIISGPLLIIMIILIIGLITITAYARRGSSEIINKVKRALTGVVIGIIIIYGAWVIIYAVLLAIGAVTWSGLNNLWIINCPAYVQPAPPVLITTHCGDGIIQRPNSSGFIEICDGTSLGGQSCRSRGFESGDLLCLGDCSGFDESNCVPYAQPIGPSLPTPVPTNPTPLVTLPPPGSMSVIVTVMNLDGAGLPYPSGDVTCAKLGYSYCEIVEGAIIGKHSGGFDVVNAACSRVFADGRHARPILRVRCHVCPTPSMLNPTIPSTQPPIDNAPTISPIGPKSVDEGQMLSFTVSGTDPDNDPLNYSTLNALNQVSPTDPPGVAPGSNLNQTTGLFTWTPTFNQAGTYTITFIVSDGQLTDMETITIIVNNVNGAPTLNSIGDKTVAQNNVLSFIITGQDPDNNPLTYSVQGNPMGASFNSTTGLFTWIPVITGSYNITFSVSDGSLSDSEAITITVTP